MTNAKMRKLLGMDPPTEEIPNEPEPKPVEVEPEVTEGGDGADAQDEDEGEVLQPAKRGRKKAPKGDS